MGAFFPVCDPRPRAGSGVGVGTTSLARRQACSLRGFRTPEARSHTLFGPWASDDRSNRPSCRHWRLPSCWWADVARQTQAGLAEG